MSGPGRTVSRRIFRGATYIPHPNTSMSQYTNSYFLHIDNARKEVCVYGGGGGEHKVCFPLFCCPSEREFKVTVCSLCLLDTFCPDLYLQEQGCIGYELYMIKVIDLYTYCFLFLAYRMSGELTDPVSMCKYFIYVN